MYKSERYLGIWTSILGVIAVLSGSLSIVTSFSDIFTDYIAADIPGGCILILFGCILLAGVAKRENNLVCQGAYAYIGSLFLVIFGACSLLIIGADGLSQILEGKDFDSARLLTSAFFLPALLSIPGVILSHRVLYQGGKS